MGTLYPDIPYDIYDLVKSFGKTCLLWTWVYVLWPAIQSIPTPGLKHLRGRHQWETIKDLVNSLPKFINEPPHLAILQSPHPRYLRHSVCKWSTRESSSLSLEEAWKPWSSLFIGRVSIERSLAHHVAGLYVKSWMGFVGPWSPCFLKNLLRCEGVIRLCFPFFFLQPFIMS